MNQVIQGLESTSPGYFADLLIFLGLVGGYLFVAFKQYWQPKLNPAPKKDTTNMTLWSKISTFGARSDHELSQEEWASIRKCRKVFIPIVLIYSIFLGFFASTFGLFTMVWIWIATVAGMLLRSWSDRRVERLNKS